MTKTAALLVFLLAAAPVPAAEDPEVAAVVADYVGLYRRETLEKWRELFLPGFVSGHTRKDGTVVQRTLAEFYASQKQYLETGRKIREELENVRIDRRGPVAAVGADFVLTDEGETSRGRLGLLLLRDRGRFRIQALVFSYHDDER